MTAPPFARLDFPPSPGRPSGRVAITAPRELLTAWRVDEVGAVLEAIDRHVAQGRHAIGFVAYDAAPAFDTCIVAPGYAGPLAWFAVADALDTPPALVGDPPRGAVHWTPRSTRAAYDAAITDIRHAIARGDLYQVNHTVQLDVHDVGDSHSMYARMIAAQGAGYGAHLHTGTHEIISASPELFVERRGDRLVTRPMKGTARRGRDAGEDAAAVAALRASDKERAENVMIVDLVRNDLGHIAIPGSVRVSSLFDVETRPTVLQMTSTIEATARGGTGTRELFAALFPCGSITGAPKLAAMAHIARAEAEPRGVYCGAIGHVGPGEATFSVAIRTVQREHHTRRSVYGVGSGITWDSAPDQEYDEVVAKADVLSMTRPSFALLETLRAEAGVALRREAHLDRLTASAAYFGWDAAAARAAAASALDAAAPACVEPSRVRLTVAANGTARVEVEPAPARSAHALPVCLAATPVDARDPWLCHKTTHRAVYDAHRAAHPGLWDVILWNARGQLTETTIGNLVLLLDGVHVTPARHCGLLDGVLRSELVAAGELREQVLTRDDLARATTCWVINALRGWTPVVVV